MSSPSNKLKILMLHGYAQSPAFFQIKTKFLVRQLHTLSPALAHKYPEGFEFLYPSGPLHLDIASFLDRPLEIPEQDTWAWWWGGPDHTGRYKELDGTLQSLSEYLKANGPVDGVVGFSQGAALAAILTALCEADTRAERREALLQHGYQYCEPPQHPLKFAVCFSGFPACHSSYGGFYGPKIRTPTLHVRGELDVVVPPRATSQLKDAFETAELIDHCGGHFVPRYTHVIRSIEQFVLKWAGELSDAGNDDPQPSHGLSSGSKGRIFAFQRLRSTRVWRYKGGKKGIK